MASLIIIIILYTFYPILCKPVADILDSSVYIVCIVVCILTSDESDKRYSDVASGSRGYIDYMSRRGI